MYTLKVTKDYMNTSIGKFDNSIVGAPSAPHAVFNGWPDSVRDRRPLAPERDYNDLCECLLRRNGGQRQ